MKTDMKLLTRTEFREGCLERDSYRCVICGETENLSVHHIIERRLWSDGGYYMENGATLCEEHHIKASNRTYTNSIFSPSCQIPEPSVLALSFGLIILAKRRR
jgi:hypothetical protein